MQFPKKFGRIAASLPNKTTAECVRFYYRTKKHIKYKEKVCLQLSFRFIFIRFDELTHLIFAALRGWS
jgi:hypothetical protein